MQCGKSIKVIIAAIASCLAAIAAYLTFIEEQGVSVEKYSVNKTAKRLGLSRSSLLKELYDGHIVAHKRRHRIIFFKQDIECYEKRNTLNYRETSSNTEKNHFMAEKRILKN